MAGSARLRGQGVGPVAPCGGTNPGNPLGSTGVPSRRRRQTVPRLALAVPAFDYAGPIRGDRPLHSSPKTWGIAAHLVLACAAVAALALAANMLVRQGTLVVRTLEVPAEAPVARVPAPPVPVPAPIVRSRPVDSGPLVAAIQRHAQVVLEQSLSPQDVDDAGVESSASDLQAQFDAYVAAAGKALGRRDAQELGEALADTQQQGGELLRLRSERAAELQRCWERIEVLSRNHREALARAWKIFGRVLARESLLEMGRQVDAMRVELAHFAQPEGYSVEQVASLEATEAALLAALDPAQAGESSERRAWLELNTAAVHEFIGARSELIGTDQRLRALREDFRRNAQTLGSLAAKPRSITVTVKAAPEPVPAEADPVPEAPPPVTRAVSTSAMELDPPWQRKTLVATSIGAVILLVLLSVLMFMRVVGPARRLLHASSRIADGDTSQRVARGGVRELDELALAFNQMSERLDAAQAVAREYQQRLESTVEERTRQLLHLAAHDPLTELPNRRELFERLAAAVDRARREGSLVGVFVLDVDNFKNLNDSVGHAFGDRVLQAVAWRLAGATATHGHSARLGGDEFTVILQDVADLEGLQIAGQELVRAFQAPLEVDGRELLLSVSVGASCFPVHGEDADSLLRAADAALFRAKALGRSQVSVYTPDLLHAAATRFTTEQGLRIAVERGDFELVYQPEINALSLEVGLVEALLRWRLPDGRLALPGEFLAIAEESGLVLGISDWVLRAAIEAAASWRLGPWPQARVAINVSVRQILDHGFETRLLDLLEQHALPPQCIELELTENVMQTGRATVAVIRRLRAAGVGIALDDFGTGYSSLASLEHLPLSRVKLDQSLVATIDTNPRSLAITRAIAGLCEQLGLEMTAEGIERPEQLALLLVHRRICLQGYLLCRPVSRADLPARIPELPGKLQSLLESDVGMRLVTTGEAISLAKERMKRATRPGT